MGIDHQVILQSAMVEAFAALREANPRFSLRAFARRLDVSPATISEILRGRRAASQPMARKIIKGLKLPPSDEAALLRRVTSSRERAFTQLDMDRYHLISKWYYFAILSLAETKGFRGEAPWVAKRLGITPTLAKQALNRLTRMRLLPLGGEAPSYATSDEIAHGALRQSHIDDLDLAYNSLLHDPVDQRDFTALTLTVDPAMIPEAKALIRKFRTKMAAKLEAAPKVEVYKLCVYFYPVTRPIPPL